MEARFSMSPGSAAAAVKSGSAIACSTKEEVGAVLVDVGERGRREDGEAEQADARERSEHRRREPEDGGASIAAGECDAHVEVGVLHEEARAANYAADEAEIVIWRVAPRVADVGQRNAARVVRRPCSEALARDEEQEED